MIDHNMKCDIIHNDNNNSGTTTQTSNRLMVYVRVKPLHHGESIINIIDDTTLVFDPLDLEQGNTDGYFYHGKQFKSIGAQKKKNSIYDFDQVFDDNSTNLGIHETVTLPMVDAFIEGHNCCVFTYGATGSGKTHTMLGKPNNPGVIYHTTKSLYERLSEISEIDPLPAELKICYFEIYNEKIRDLLHFEPNNFIRCGNKRLRTTYERRGAGQVVRDANDLLICEPACDGQSSKILGLTYHSPKNAEQLLSLLVSGNANPSRNPTDAKTNLGRAHTCLQIILTRKKRRTQNDCLGPQIGIQRSKMSLIDLAGSKRASFAYRSGNDSHGNLHHGNMNKSLLALGNCINALAGNNRGGQRHIPYRNSKLTRLLKESLGGKCRTAMIATISQQHTYYNDTQNALIYASRAKCIETRLGRNSKDVASKPKSYSPVIENHSIQISTLQSQDTQLKFDYHDPKQKLVSSLDLRRVIGSIEISNPDTTTIDSVKQPSPNTFMEKSYYGPKLVALCDERDKIKMDSLRNEFKCRINDLTFSSYEQGLPQVNCGGQTKMNGETTFSVNHSLTGTLPETSIKHSRALKTQLDLHEQERKIRLRNALLSSVDENEKKSERTITKMPNEFVFLGHGTCEDSEEMINKSINERNIIHELEAKFCEQRAYDLAQQDSRRLLGAGDLLNEAASIIRSTQAIPIEGGLSPKLENRSANCRETLCDVKKEIWKNDKFEMDSNSCNEIIDLVSPDRQDLSLSEEEDSSVELDIESADTETGTEIYSFEISQEICAQPGNVSDSCNSSLMNSEISTRQDHQVQHQYDAQQSNKSNHITGYDESDSEENRYFSRVCETDFGKIDQTASRNKQNARILDDMREASVVSSERNGGENFLTFSQESKPDGIFAPRQTAPRREQQVETLSLKVIRANSKSERATLLNAFVKNRIPCQDPDRHGQFLGSMIWNAERPGGGRRRNKDASFEPGLFKIRKILGYKYALRCRLMFYCQIKSCHKLSKRWIDYEHMAVMEPRGKFIDYIRSMYVFNQPIYRNMIRNIFCNDVNADILKNMVGEEVEQVCKESLKKVYEEMKRRSMAKKSKT